MPKKIYLIDWNSFIYRMFFALPEFATKDGQIVNAIFGMAKFFVWQLIREKPDYLVFIKDAKGKNFRHDLYEDYKATRDRMPDNLRSQIKGIEEMIWLMGIDIIEKEGYEADDVIWTLAVALWKNLDYEIDILTADKDLYSLVSENVSIYDTMKRKKFWPEETREKFWVDSSMIIDYLAIVWDKADNIPGIDGFWPKKAIELINYIGSVEKVYITAEKIQSWAHLEEIHPELDSEAIKAISSCFRWKTFEKLIISKDDAFLSKRLATIPHDVELENFKLENFKFKPEELLNEEVKDYFRGLEFNSLIWEDDKELQKWKNLGLKVNIIWDKEGILKLDKVMKKYDEIVFDTETTSLNIIKATIVWVSIYLDDEHIYYINRMHSWPQIEDKDLKDFLQKLLDSPKLLIAHNLKYDLEIIELFLAKKWENTNKEKNNQWQMILSL